MAEILVLIAVVDQIGIGWTVLALAISALLGVIVIRVLGAASLVELRDALARREPPAGALFRGACVLAAGMLLILPGFLSDVVALLLLIPPVRGVLVGALWRWLRRPRGEEGAVVIEGEYRELRPERDALSDKPERDALIDKPERDALIDREREDRTDRRPKT